MNEAKIKAILENKITLLAKLAGQMEKQVKAVDQNDVSSLTQILDEKEAVIESLVSDDQKLEKEVALLDEKNRVAIANKLKGLGTLIESEIEKITRMENDCEKNLLNEKMELLEKMRSTRNGRTLLKGYGVSARIKPKISGSI
jgi:adenylate cyclase